MKQLKVLGIDYSLNGTGLALYDGKEIIFKKVFSMVQKHDGLEEYIYVPKMEDTMAKIDIVAHNIINCTDYDYVLMEDHIGRYYNWMDGYGIIKYLLRQNNKPYIMASPTMIKKYAGNGGADKKLMDYYLKRDYDFDFSYIGKLANNIVDASWMAIMGWKLHKIYIEKEKGVTDTPLRLKILDTLAKKNGIGV